MGHCVAWPTPDWKATFCPAPKGSQVAPWGIPPAPIHRRVLRFAPATNARPARKNLEIARLGCWRGLAPSLPS